MVLSASPTTHAVEFAGGTGEPNDPYLIATAEQLLAADFSVPGVYFRLSRNIDLDRKEFGAGLFRAHLDGAGFEIQNAVNAMGASFIDAVEPEGSIANLTLADFDIGLAVWPDSSGGHGSVGGLAMVNRGTISNCGATGWISTWRIILVGGLVGQNQGSIVNCYFDGWIGTNWEVRTIEDEGDSPHAGGLVGYNTGLIANSFARGYVVGRMGLGGLVGSNGYTGRITDSYATCTVIGDVGSGGLVSENWGSLRNCYANGWVMGQMRGGLVGMASRYSGSATGCLWDMFLTDCPRSGDGIGFPTLRSDRISMALNGWAGDPNWVVLIDPNNLDTYPRLAWEGTPGEIVPEYPVPRFDEGSGTQSDPYVIRTEEALRRMCRASIYWDKHFVLANDLDLWAAMNFSPIGICSGSSFSGTFDGNGHVIRNLREGAVNDGESPAWNFGLFGYVTGEVRNLTLENFGFAGGTNSCRVGIAGGHL
jgi:hypothetical protein